MKNHIMKDLKVKTWICLKTFFGSCHCFQKQVRNAYNGGGKLDGHVIASKSWSGGVRLITNSFAHTNREHDQLRKIGEVWGGDFQNNFAADGREKNGCCCGLVGNKKTRLKKRSAECSSPRRICGVCIFSQRMQSPSRQSSGIMPMWLWQSRYKQIRVLVGVTLRSAPSPSATWSGRCAAPGSASRTSWPLTSTTTHGSPSNTRFGW